MWGGNARVRLRARGTLLLDLLIVACFQHATPVRTFLPHTALHFVALMWGYWDIVPPARKVQIPRDYSIHVGTTFATRHSPSSFSNVAW
jgi:hypothetical protein